MPLPLPPHSGTVAVVSPASADQAAWRPFTFGLLRARFLHVCCLQVLGLVLPLLIYLLVVMPLFSDRSLGWAKYLVHEARRRETLEMRLGLGQPLLSAADAASAKAAEAAQGHDWNGWYACRNVLVQTRARG